LLSIVCIVHFHRPPRDLPSFPTRRSSDLHAKRLVEYPRLVVHVLRAFDGIGRIEPGIGQAVVEPVAKKVQRIDAEFDAAYAIERSEEHTSELQSQSNLVCRLLLEKTNQTTRTSWCSTLSGRARRWRKPNADWHQFSTSSQSGSSSSICDTSHVFRLFHYRYSTDAP